MNNLTEKQQRLYDFYTNKSNWHLKPPTLMDCKTYMGVRSDQSVMDMLDRIASAGYPLNPKE